MRPVNERVDPLFSTHLDQSLKRHSHTRQTRHRVEQRHPHLLPRRLFPLQHPLKPPHHLIVRDRIRILDLDPLRRRRLGNILDRLLARAVDGAEIDDAIALLEAQTAQHHVDASRGVWHEDDRVDGDVEEGRHCLTRLVQIPRVLVAEEAVGVGFGEVLEVVHVGADGGGVGAEGAWLGEI